jgi:peroxiredoxin Q/BCP
MARTKKKTSKKKTSKKAAAKKAGKKKAGKKKAGKKKAAKKTGKKKAGKKPAKKAGKKKAAKKTGKKKPAAKKKSGKKKPAAKKKSGKKPAARKVPKKPAKKSGKKTSIKQPVPAIDVEQPSLSEPEVMYPSGGNGVSSTTPAPGLAPGDDAPSFELQADDGRTYCLEDLEGERFVLYFYPKDDTPGCTAQACGFRDQLDAFSAAGAKILGVSSDSIQSHVAFRDKFDLSFPLLSDPSREVAKAYGAIGEKNMYGRKTIGVIRSTFVIGPDGRVEHVFSPVRVPGHVQAVLDRVESSLAQ